MTAAITHMEIAEITKDVAKGFDYQSLAPETAVQAKAAVARIQKRGASIQTAILEIGQDLLWAKEALGHGNFLPWLSAELDMSASTAERYMNVAANLDAKFVTVTNLPPALLYSLASPSTPPVVRSAVVESVLKGERLAEAEIKDKLASARKQVAKGRAEAAKSPEAKKQAKARKAQQEREFARRMEEQNKKDRADRAAADVAVAYLRERLGDDFAEFRQLFDKTGYLYFASALSNAR